MSPQPASTQEFGDEILDLDPDVGLGEVLADAATQGREVQGFIDVEFGDEKFGLATECCELMSVACRVVAGDGDLPDVLVDVTWRSTLP